MSTRFGSSPGANIGLQAQMLDARYRIAEERRKIRERMEAEALRKINDLPRRNIGPVSPEAAAPLIDLDPGLPQRRIHAQRINDQLAQQQQINAQTEEQMRRAAQGPETG